MLKNGILWQWIVAFLEKLEQGSNQTPVLYHWATNLVYRTGHTLICWILKWLWAASQSVLILQQYLIVNKQCSVTKNCLYFWLRQIFCNKAVQANIPKSLKNLCIQFDASTLRYCGEMNGLCRGNVTFFWKLWNLYRCSCSIASHHHIAGRLLIRVVCEQHWDSAYSDLQSILRHQIVTV